MSSPPAPAEIEAALKASVAALERAGVRFMLGGSLAAWARGGPPSRKDLDLMVAPADAEGALRALADAGLRTDLPPESWLFKAYHGETLIDIIFAPTGVELDDAAFARAERMDVLALPMLVMSLEDVITTKLLVLDEHNLDLEPTLQIARALREQVDWEQVRTRTAASPFACAFFTLVEQLRVVAPSSVSAAARRSRVRVVGAPDPGEGPGSAR